MADLTAPIAYNGLTMSSITPTGGGAPISGYVVERFNASQVDIRQFVENRALQEGLDAGDIYLGSRRLVIQVAAYGSTKGDLWDKTQDFLEAFNPVIAYNNETAVLGFRALTFFQPTANVSTWPTSAYPNGIPMLFYARPFLPPTYEVVRDATGGVTGKGGAVRLTAQLLCKDPRKYHTTQQSLALTTSNQAVTHRGDFPTYPSFEFTMSGAGSSNFQIILDSTTIAIDLSGTTSGTYRVVYASQTFKNISSGTSLVDKFVGTPSFAQVQPGSSSVCRIANNTNVSSPTLKWNESWC